MPEIRVMPNAEIVTVCDIIPERAREYARRWDVPAWYGDIDDTLAGSDFDFSWWTPPPSRLTESSRS